MTQLTVRFPRRSDGREAYEAMKGTRYDMVVMDLDMPVMDGLSSTASIRQWERATPSTTPQRICAILCGIQIFNPTSM